ncbi:hypothetical protein BJV77DRAFT_269074 [Russula vinacea]|nr:hypothetical protein BJV77DRAFT_269074 [Russula vinacea]
MKPSLLWSSAHSHTALLSHFFRPQFAPPHSAATLTPNRTRPWSFLEDPNPCRIWIEHCVEGDGTHELEVIYHVQEHMYHLRLSLSAPSPSDSVFQGTLLPLRPGTFTQNRSRRAHHHRVHQVKLDQ